MTDTTDSGPQNAAETPGSGKATRRAARRAIRYNAATAGPLLRAAAAASRANEDEHTRKATMTKRSTDNPPDKPAAETVSDDASDDLGLSAEEWAEAAEAMSQEATQAEADTGSAEADTVSAEPKTPTWAQALRAPQDDDSGDDDVAETSNAEAAKFRVRMKSAEAELSATRDRLENLQRREVETIAADRMSNAADLWLTETKIGDLLDAAGDVDGKRVQEAISATLQTRPHWGKRMPFGRMRSGASSAAEPEPASWSQALRQPAEG